MGNWANRNYSQGGFQFSVHSISFENTLIPQLGGVRSRDRRRISLRSYPLFSDAFDCHLRNRLRDIRQELPTLRSKLEELRTESTSI